MKWLICLSGDTFDLDELSKSINSDFYILKNIQFIFQKIKT